MNIFKYLFFFIPYYVLWAVLIFAPVVGIILLAQFIFSAWMSNQGAPAPVVAVIVIPSLFLWSYLTHRSAYIASSDNEMFFSALVRAWKEV